jgi:cytochrome c oxidase subunit 2
LVPDVGHCRFRIRSGENVRVDHLTNLFRAARAGDRGALARFALATGITTAMAFGAAACGDDAGSDTGPSLPPAAENGRRLAQSSGCAGCHGSNFEGGAGPSLVGLAGSEVLLTDGTTVIADDAYLATSISDPAKQLVDGYTLKMPANNLSDDEVADIVEFINTLAGTP